MKRWSTRKISEEERRERFWTFVRVAESGCWEWTRSRMPYGYGLYALAGGRNALAHRYAYALVNGAIPRGLCVCHRCDNPPCVNPDHLFLGSHRENAHDKIAKGRGNTGERNGSALLTAERVRDLRARAEEGASLSELGAEFGVSPTTAWKAVRRMTWRHVA